MNRNFDDFCAYFRCSKSERDELWDYLAFLRLKAMLRAAKEGSDAM